MKVIEQTLMIIFWTIALAAVLLAAGGYLYYPLAVRIINVIIGGV